MLKYNAKQHSLLNSSKQSLRSFYLVQGRISAISGIQFLQLTLNSIGKASPLIGFWHHFKCPHPPAAAVLQSASVTRREAKIIQLQALGRFWHLPHNGKPAKLCLKPTSKKRPFKNINVLQLSSCLRSLPHVLSPVSQDWPQAISKGQMRRESFDSHFLPNLPDSHG